MEEEQQVCTWAYLEGEEFQGRLMLIAGYLARKLEESTAILDLNCGTGPILDYLPQCRYVGNDADPDSLMAGYLRCVDRPDTVFLRATDEALAEALSIDCDVLLCLGYACGFSVKESHTLADSIRRIVETHEPDAVILEGWAHCCDYGFGDLASWIEDEGYRSLPWWCVHPDVMDDHRANRMVVILERRGGRRD